MAMLQIAIPSSGPAILFFHSQGAFLRQCLNLAGICVRKQVSAVHLSIQSFPFFCPCEHDAVAEAPGSPWSFSDRIMQTISTHERGELKTFLFLIQLEYWQAVDAENGGDFAAVMDVMFEHMPDDPLERNCGSHFSRQACCIHPHLSEWLERRLYQFRVPHTFRIIQRREDLLKISRGQTGKRLLDHLPGLLKSGNQFCRRVEWIHAPLTDTQSP